MFQVRDNICLNQVKENRNEEDKAHLKDILKIELAALKDPANEREMLRMILKFLVQMIGWMEKTFTVEIKEQLAPFKRR